MEYRPLEGFVFAVTPFNFTAIGGNLPGSAALMGNTVSGSPASTAAYSAHFLMKLFEEAGLPPGVINLVYGSGSEIGDPRSRARTSRASTSPARRPVFQSMWKTIGANIANYRNYPRIVGETGGKDFIVAHPSADAEAGRDRDRARQLRVPGPEVLRRLAHLRARRTSGRRSATASSRTSRRSASATSRTSATSWAPSSTPARSARRRRRSTRRRRPTR
jgi:hypothetical protein